MALARLRNNRAAEALLRVALKDTSPIARITAIIGLRRLKNPQTMLPLINALNDADSNVRGEAADTLNFLIKINPGIRAYAQTDIATSSLLDALHHTELGVPEVAATLLGMLGDRQALPPLIASLTSRKSIRLRKEAKKALFKIDPSWMKSPEAQAAITALTADKHSFLPKEDAEETLRMIKSGTLTNTPSLKNKRATTRTTIRKRSKSRNDRGTQSENPRYLFKRADSDQRSRSTCADQPFSGRVLARIPIG